MPAFPKPNPTETDPVAGPNLTTHAALTTTAHGGIVASNDARLTDGRVDSTARASAATAQSTADGAVVLAGTKARPILPWATATAYLRGEAVTNGGRTYVASDAHTSGATFAGDLGSHWTLELGTVAALDVDTTTSLGTSDAKVPSQKAVKSYVDGATPADASTSVKGVAKLSVAPVSASAPIAVGDNDMRVLPEAIFGNGADGDVTITGTVTLTRDMQYRNLVVNGTLETGAFRVMVCGTLTGAGTIKWTPCDGVGTGGVPFTNSGFYQKGSNGGDSSTAAGVAAADPGFAVQLGGQGGAGGLGSGGAGGARPTLNGTLVSHSGVSLTDVSKIHPMQLWIGRGIVTSAAAYCGGTGGGGGGGDGTKGASGGQGGGVVAVFAFDARGFTGTISANGGAGGSPPAGNRGGGGGGGGGLAALFTKALPTGSYTITATGGAGGTKQGTGVNGNAGDNGTTIAAVI